MTPVRGGSAEDERSVDATPDADATPSYTSRSRLQSDRARYWTSTGSAILATIVVIGPAMVSGGVAVDLTGRTVAIVYFVMWVLFCWFYAGLTWRAMHGHDGSALARLLRESAEERRARRRTESFWATGGPSAAVVLCLLALVAVLFTAVLPELRTDAIVAALAVAVVAATWVLLVAVYAVHYAREQANVGGLRFPGDDGEAPFEDFVYVAVQVATTFATSDVTVTSTAMRREVTLHSVIVFTFNTVVVALLVSVLVAGRG
ncbi:DUF1345 domain-containing protein [Phycicoccus sp. BSK3Z-2]|uniref:DUF1345 domain-containing protein n=1 Tax=Phycicoccus avicenniae TaxID=2828860 RepID=A0A941HXH5_9MICO|nr:DUF1345 domain-containing protein [Phycicoccus avicenniae]MBR7741848.1 DUF1345 domain-containing protein [Phycicoccus avicenniae]